VVHGLRYVFPPSWTGVARGIPTSYAAPPLSESIVQGELPPVWPHPEGQTRGQGLRPIYKSVPEAALNDADLRYLLALFAKEVALHAHGVPGSEAALESLVEILAHAERNLASV
jgi:hypothetical protein